MPKVILGCINPRSDTVTQKYRSRPFLWNIRSFERRNMLHVYLTISPQITAQFHLICARFVKQTTSLSWIRGQKLPRSPVTKVCYSHIYACLFEILGHCCTNFHAQESLIETLTKWGVSNIKVGSRMWDILTIREGSTLKSVLQSSGSLKNRQLERDLELE